MDGNQALAYGLIAAGVRYGAGYPITPWSSVMEILRSELPKYGGIFVQAEDELGAVSHGARFLLLRLSRRHRQRRPRHLAQDRSASAGRRWRRCRSSLSTCSAAARAPACPTNVEQSDLIQAIFGGHGDSPRVVLAAADGRGLLLHRDRGGADRAQIQHAGFHLERHLPRDAHRGVRRTGSAKDLMIDPKPDLSPRPAGFKPYPLDTDHAARRRPARRCSTGNIRSSPASSTTRWAIRPAARRCTWR